MKKPKPSYATLERKLRLARAEIRSREAVRLVLENWLQAAERDQRNYKAEIAQLRALLQQWMDRDTDRAWAKLNEDDAMMDKFERGEDISEYVDWDAGRFFPGPSAIPLATTWSLWRNSDNI